MIIKENLKQNYLLLLFASILIWNGSAWAEEAKVGEVEEVSTEPKVSEVVVTDKSNLVVDKEAAVSEIVPTEISSEIPEVKPDVEVATEDTNEEATEQKPVEEVEQKIVEAEVENVQTPRSIVGWVERIKIVPEELLLNAKLTPGSEGNAFHAKDVKRFKKGGKDWVKFSVTDRKGKTEIIEREVVDKIKVRNAKGKVIERIEVTLGLCLAEVYIEIDFGLSDRSDFDHEVRIGRDALAGNFLIDPSSEKTKKPKCKKASK